MGCKKESDAAAISWHPAGGGAATTEAGWNAVKTAGISMSLPAELVTIDLSSGDAEKISADVKAKLPKLPAEVGILKGLASSGSFKLIAMSPEPVPIGNFKNNLNVLSMDVPAGQDLDAIINLNKSQLGALASSLKFDKRKLPAGDAGCFVADLGSGQLKHGDIGYILVHGSKQFVFSFSCALSDKAEWTKLADKVMNTVHFD